MDKKMIDFAAQIKSKKQIRTKKICAHPNPLFEKWLKEWKIEAENRGSKMKHNYQKAIKSLQKYPLPLHSGKECEVLANFGNKICDLIDKKLEEYIIENGPINWDDYIKVEDMGRKLKAKRKRKSMNNVHKVQHLPAKDENSACVGKGYHPAFRSGSYALLLTLYRKCKKEGYQEYMKKQELMEEAQELCNASFFVPSEGGSHYTAWASMSTLIKKNLVEKNGNPSRYSLTFEGELLASEMESPNCVFTSKNPVEEKSTSDSLKSVSSKDTTKKGSRYMLNISDSDENSTDEDDRDENKLSLDDDLINNDEISIIDDISTSDKASSLNNERRSENSRISSVSSSVSLDLSFSYVTDAGLDTPSKAKAFVMVDEDKGTLLFLIKAKLIDLLSSDLDYQLEDTRVAPPGYTFAYLRDDSAPDLCTEVKENKPLQKDILEMQPSRSGRLYSSSDDSEADTCVGLFSRINGKPSDHQNGGIGKKRPRDKKNVPEGYCRNSKSKKSCPEIEDRNFIKDRRKLNNEEKECKKTCLSEDGENANLFPAMSVVSGKETNYYKPSSSMPENKANGLPSLGKENRTVVSSVSGHFNGRSETTLETTSDNFSIPEEDLLFTMRPNSYKVVLNIDNTEVYGGSTEGRKRGSKEIISNDLQKNKIDFCVRNLNVGDFVWTCKGFDLNGKEQEVVLPYAVERKRMDDLGQSIRDGRFKEQKFRLKQSGLPHLIYLVEEFGSNNSIVPIATCEQAITNTQVIDNFIIKITKDQRESAAYLTIMTRYLQSKFKGKTLHCVKRESPLLSRGLSSSSVLYLMSFNDLNSFSVKNRSLSVREMLAKHLLQINGASVDKVTSILHKYPTPRSLIEALECRSASAREGLLCDIKCQKSGRQIDQSVSSHIARLYTWENLL